MTGSPDLRRKILCLIKDVSQNESFVAHPFFPSTTKAHPVCGTCVEFWACKNQPTPHGRSFCGSFLLLAGYAVIFSDARVWSRPCSRFIHSFFRLKANARKNISVRTFAFPVVRKRRNPKSFFRSANAPSA